jgi:hypothetical protein
LESGEYIPNTLLIKPVIHMFSGEYESGLYRKCLVEAANNLEKYKSKIQNVILDSVDFYRTVNPEAMECRNGKRIVRPSSHYLAATSSPSKAVEKD